MKSIGEMRKSSGVRRHLASGLALSLGLSVATFGSDQPRVLEAEHEGGGVLAAHREDRGHVVVVDVSGDYDYFEPGGASNIAAREAVSSEVLATHADEYDFLLVLSSFAVDLGPNVRGRYVPVRNEISGIGLDLFDRTGEFGSSGALQGYVDLGALAGYAIDGSPADLEKCLQVASHEILHRWGAYVRYRDAEGVERSDLATSGGHWSYLAHTSGSLLYGNNWRDEGDGSFRSIDAVKVASPLDLYLAGFLAPDEVPPFFLVRNETIDPERPARIGDQISGTAETVTLADIVAVEGPRVPPSSSSQREFRSALVYLVRPGEEVSAGDLAALEALRGELVSRFAVLTGGRGRLEIHPQAAGGPQPGSPGPVEGGPIRPGVADLGDATAWLAGRQLSDGSWHDHESTPTRDTEAATRALLAAGHAFDRAATTNWALAAATPSLDSRVQVSRLLEHLDRQEELAAARSSIGESQNGDGGWGAEANYRSDPFDTALAMVAEPTGADEAAAIAKLLATQNADGSWGSVAGGQGSVLATVESCRALIRYGHAEQAENGFAWLAAHQNPDGGFGNSPSTAHTTAEVLLLAREAGNLGAIDAPAAADYLRSRQTVEGSWEGSVYATARALEALLADQNPDWVVATPLSAEPAEPALGEPVTLRLGIRNGGGSPLPAGTVRFFDGDPDAGGVALDTDRPLPPLAPGDTFEVFGSWAEAGPEGAHEIFAVVDPDETTAESNEANNRSSLTVQVSGPVPGVDLELRATGIAFTPSMPNLLPSTVTVGVTLFNRGADPEPGARVRLWMGDPESGLVVGEQVVPVGASSSVPVYFPVELETPGPVRFTAVADPDDQIAEARESNNTAWRDLSTVPSLDVEVLATDIALLDPPYPGADARFAVTLRNRGTITAPNFLARFEVVDGDETIPVDQGTVTIGPGATVSRTISWRVERAGELAFRVVVDSDDSLAELDESNNSASIPFLAGAPGVPNLAVSYVDVAFAPEPALEGAPETISALVRNTGGVAAPSFTVGYFDGDPENGGELLGTTTVGALEPGASALVTFPWAEVPDPADRFVHVVVDPDDELAELDEADNRAFRLLEVLSLPDAALGPGSVTLSPAFPVPGQPVTVSIEMSNLGEQALDGLAARVFLGDPDGGGVEIGPDVSFAIVPGGGSGVAQTSFSPAESLPAGEIVVVVDPEGMIVEGDESNNRASASIAVQDADLFVSERYFSPDGDGIRDTTTLSFRLESAATVAVEIRDRWGTLLRRATAPEWDEVVEGSFVWDGTTDRGRVARDGDVTLEVVGESGVPLGQALATIDTNRSPALDAAGTPYEAITNLTCAIAPPSPPGLQFGSDERNAFLYYGWREPGQPVGIYRMDGKGGPLQTVLGPSWFESQGLGDLPDEPIAIWPSASGGFVAFSERTCGCGDCTVCSGTFNRRLFLTTASGAGTRELLLDGEESGIHGFFDGDRKLLATDGTSGALVSLATGAATPPAVVYSPDGWIQGGSLSPDRRRFLASVDTAEGMRLDLVDLGSGAGQPVLLGDEEASSPVWSRDGSLLALWNPQTQRLMSIAATGQVLTELEIPLGEDPENPASSVTPLGYSTWNDELAFETFSMRDCELWWDFYAVDLLTEAFRWLGAATRPGCNLASVQVHDGTGWRELGRYEPRRASDLVRLEIPREGLVEAGPLRLRIVPDAGQVARVETLELHADGVLVSPSRRTDPSRYPSQSIRSGNQGVLDEEPLANEPFEWAIPSHGALELNLRLRPPSASDSATVSRAGGDSTSRRIGFGAEAHPALGGEASGIWQETGGPWVPNDRAIFTSWGYNAAAPLWAFRLDPEAEPQSLMSDFSTLRNKALSPTGRRLLFDSDDPALDPESSCFGSGPDTLAVDNWLNLGTELAARREPGMTGVLLSGTAADRNFSRYRLDYSVSGGEPTWMPIAPPSTREVFGAPFQTWIPPGPGVFVVRLTTEDRAGNARTATQRVYSATTPVLTDFNVSPEEFSPNGDGILDVATVSYRLIVPSNLEFTIVDAHGAVVRTFSRSHTTPGEFSFPWDGRNSNGVRVPDGGYRVRVLTYEQLVAVDTASPVLPELSHRPASFCNPAGISGAGGHLNVTYELLPSLISLPYTVGYQRGLAPTPSAWLNASPTGISFPNASTYLYRATAQDHAGNVAVSQAEMPPPFVFLGSASPQPTGVPTGYPGATTCAQNPVPPIVPENGLLRLEALESVAGLLSVSAVRSDVPGPVGCANPTPSAASATPLASYRVGDGVPWGSPLPDQAFEVLWDASALPPGDHCVWLEGMMNDAEPWTSNGIRVRVPSSQTTLRLSRGGPEGFAATAQGPLGDLYRAAVAAGAVVPGGALTYLGEIDGDDAVANVALVVGSDEDPRYSPALRLAPVFGSGRLLLFLQPLWDVCTHYSATLVGERPNPSGGTTPIAIPPMVFSTDCFSVRSMVRPDWARSCDEIPSGDLLFAATPSVASGAVGLSLLTIGRLLPNGQEELWASWNQPTPGTTYEYRLDTSELEEGGYRYRVRLRNNSGDEVVAVDRFVVAHEPPAVQVTYPIEGEQLCAATAEIRWVASDEDELECRKEVNPVGSCAGPNGLFSACGPPTIWPPELRCRTGQMQMHQANGPIEIHFEAAGWSGHLACDVRTVEIDGISEGLAALLGPALLSPNGDGVLDSTTLLVNVAESMSVSATIYPAVRAANDWVIAGPPVRSLLDGVPVLDSRVVDWDGDDDDGAPLPDGNYLVVVAFIDGCANVRVRQILVQIDTTPPVVTIHYPEPGDPLPMLVSVRASIEEPHPADFQLEAGAGADPSTWALFGAGTGEFEDRIVGTWNSFGLVGPQSLRLVSHDEAGNVGEARVTVVVDAPFRLLSYLEAVPPLFSPNGDGRREESAIRFGVEAEAVISVRVETPSGAPVRTLVDAQNVLPGAQALSWNGTTGSGTPAPDGEYRMFVDAALASNGNVTQSEWIPLLVDRAPPVVTIHRPADGFASGSGSVVGTISDARLATYTVELAAGAAPGVWTEIDAGSANRLDAPLGSLEGLEEGPYWLRLRAEDQAENRIERLVPFSVDNTPPDVTLEAPSPGSLHAAAAGPVEVRGTVHEVNPATWLLEAGAGEVPSSWRALESGTGNPAGALAQWSLAGLPDGVETLRLSSRDRAGLSGAATLQVVVDNTPPLAAIQSPAADGFVRSSTEIVGTASDAHLADYRLGVAPEGSPLFSEIIRGVVSVDNATLGAWAALPPDGVYRLRLDVVDLAGNSRRVEVPVTVDTRPPSPPILQATLENGHDARLHWSTSPEADVVGYEIDRDGVTIPGAPVSETSYLDPDLGDGTHRYVVRAVDRAGWRSAPSNESSVAVDRTPPVVRLSVPNSGARVSGVVEIVGTAWSADDFHEFRLFATPAGGGAPTLLARSTSPVEGETIAAWSTAGLAEESLHRIRLEADDQAGNPASDEVEVVVDNQAPAPATELIATVPGGSSDVEIEWTASNSPDVDGYLLYRDEALVNAAGGAPADLSAYLLRTTSYVDSSRPDGTYTYVVLAMDHAGNLSVPSNEAQATVSLQAPHAIVVEPADGAEIDGAVEVVAESEDQDVVEVRFQYRLLGETDWIDLIPVDVALPWSVVFDPAALEPPLAFGDYELQAVARDVTDLVDPGPTPIRLTYTEFAPPAAPIDLVATVAGGDVSLAWSGGGEPDLDGFVVERAEGDDSEWIRITPAPIASSSFVDEALPDAVYRYRVLAIDVEGNESSPSTEAVARVHTPRVRQPYTPTEARVTDLSGQTLADVSVEVLVTNAGGTTGPSSLVTDGAGRFAFDDLELALGDNSIVVHDMDALGNTSKPVTLYVWSGDRPGAPTGLVAIGGAEAHAVDLSWNSNPEADILGYRLRRNAEALPPPSLLAVESASASSEEPWAPAVAAVDGDASTYWAPADQGLEPLEEQWIELELDAPELVRSFELEWFSDQETIFGAADFDVSGWDGRAWVPLAEVRDSQTNPLQLELPRPYRTDRLRIEVLRPIGPPAGGSYVALAEARVTGIPVIDGLAWSDTAPDGSQSYRVTAWNQLGFESDPSDPATIDVGDVEPPLPVVLSAGATGADVMLSWTASASPDVERYELYRDGAIFGEHTDLGNLSAFDLGRPNGTFVYTVRPVDIAGNRGELSNAVPVTIDVPPPPVTFELQVSGVAEGRALDLSWQEPAGAPPAGYRVFRSLVSGGGYVLVAGLAERTFRDTSVTDGVTYFYEVIAVDAGGIAISRSNEASGTPSDVTAAPPAIFFPTVPGRPLAWQGLSAPIAGWAEPGSSVALYRNGVWVGVASARAEDEIGLVALSGGVLLLRASPDGNAWIWVDGDGQAHLTTSGGGSVDLSDAGARWSWNGRTVWSVAPGGADLAESNLDGSLKRSVTVSGNAWSVAPGPDGRRLATILTGASGEGLTLLDLENGEETLVYEAPPWEIDADSVAWSPDGGAIAFLRDAFGDWRIVVVRLDEGIVTSVELDPGASYERPSWSQDGFELYWTSHPGDSDEIWRWERATGISSSIAESSGGRHGAQTSPAGNRVAMLDWDGRLFLVDAEGNEVELHDFEANNDGPRLEWTSSGTLFATERGEVFRFDFAGSFRHPAVPLTGGTNEIRARATDLTGNTSLPSEAIELEVPATAAPDLVLLDSDLTHWPQAPLASTIVRLSATVRNFGASAAPPSTLSLSLEDPAGGSVVIASSAAIDAIAPGAARSRSFDVTLPPTGGTYRVRAAVDPSDVVPELDESNNRAVHEFVVASLAGPGVSISSDRTVYGAGAAVGLAVGVTNAGPSFTGRLRVRVEDAEGFEMAVLVDQAIVSLPYGGSLPVAASWLPGDVFSGNYQARAELADANGEIVASDSTAFSIGEQFTLYASIRTDRPGYVSGESVGVRSTFTYANGNAILAGLSARIRLVTVAGAVRREWNVPLGELLPGSGGTIERIWTTTGEVPDDYSARIDVLRSDAVLATSSAPFVVLPSPPRAHGALALSPESPTLGEPLEASWSATLDVGEPAPGALARLALVDPATGETLEARDLATQLFPGQTVGGVETFSTALLALRTYLVVLTLDLDGPAPVELPRPLATDSFVPADRVAPLVTVVRPGSGSLLGGALDVVVTAFDQHSSVASVEGSVDGGDWIRLRLADASAGRYGHSLDGLVEGAHVLVVRATDAWENARESGPVPFEVDLTPPAIAVVGVVDGGLYSDPVAPVISVSDLHPGWTVVTLDQRPFASGTEVAIPGSHTLRVVAEDAAGNRAERSLVFEIAPLAQPSLSAIKSAGLAVDFDGDGRVGPGDEVEYTIVVASTGNANATGVRIVDVVPVNTELVAESLVISTGTVTSLDPVTVDVPVLDAGLEATVIFRVRVAIDFPVSELEITNQAQVSATGIPDFGSDDPATPTLGDATRTEVHVVPSITIADASTEESAGPVEMVVALSRASNRDTRFAYATVAGTAEEGADYVATTGTITIPAGDLGATIEVTVLDDDEVENAETFDLVLTEPENGTVLDGVGRVTILDDDLPTVSVIPAEIAEGEAGVAVVTFDPPPLAAVVLTYATEPDTAEEGIDYVAAEGEIVADTGTESLSIPLTTLEDFLDEPLEEFRVRLTSISGGVLGKPVATITIADDDGPPAIEAAKSATVLDDDGKFQPGDRLRYTIVVASTGASLMTGIRFLDSAPCPTAVVPGSVTTSVGIVASEEPVVVDVGSLDPGQTAIVEFDVEAPVTGADPPLENLVSNQGLVTSVELPDRATDDPAQPGEADPTVVGLYGWKIFVDGFESADDSRWPPADRIFASGFECGDATTWSQTVSPSAPVSGERGRVVGGRTPARPRTGGSRGGRGAARRAAAFGTDLPGLPEPLRVDFLRLEDGWPSSLSRIARMAEATTAFGTTVEGRTPEAESRSSDSERAPVAACFPRRDPTAAGSFAKGRVD